MEIQKQCKQQQQEEFALASVTELACSSTSSSRSDSKSAPVIARFSAGNGVAVLRFNRDSESTDSISVDVKTARLFKLGPLQSVCIAEASGADTGKEKYSTGVTVQFRNEEESRTFHCAFEQWKKKDIVQGTLLPNGAVTSFKSKFEDKIEPSSAKMYFHYYGQLLHQQNMMQDYVRTGTYYAAVMENRVDFIDRVVVDVGAGSGILSLFAAQAGAKHVYAVEASEMAEYARKLIAGNPSLGERITVIKGKVEEVELPEKADVLISEPMGTLLVNERMLESYVIARDRFLVPNGKMFPAVGSSCKVRSRIHMAPFSDEYLFVEIANKALFWQQQKYFGVDLTPLYGSAFGGYFSQPVVDAFDPRLLVAPAVSHHLDFTEIKEEDLYEIDIPLKFVASVGTRVHGLACWFDVFYLRELIRKTRSLTDKPFGVGLVLAFPHEENLKVILDEKVAVLQVYWGECSQELVLEAHLAGVKVVPQVGSFEDARKAIDAGVDGIIVQGREAGGHVIGQEGLISILPRVVDLVGDRDIPVIAAGGIVNERGYVAALVLGAKGVCLGTRFVATEESNAHPTYKRKLVELDRTEYTNIFGRARWPNAPQRALVTQFFNDWKSLPPHENEINQPVIGRSTINGEEKEIRRFGGPVPNMSTTGDIESMAMYAGQGVGLIKEILPASEVIKRLVEGAQQLIRNEFAAL